MPASAVDVVDGARSRQRASRRVIVANEITSGRCAQSGELGFQFNPFVTRSVTLLNDFDASLVRAWVDVGRPIASAHGAGSCRSNA